MNTRRKNNELSTVRQWDPLTEMGESHSAVMARQGQIGHVEPGGITIRDRFERRGLLAECRIPLQESNRFYPGAENVAQTWVDREVMEDGGLVYIGSEEEVARNLLHIWMNSPPHRKPMMLPATDRVGLGLNITEGNKVYASLEMCGH